MRRRVFAVAALMLAAACGVADDSTITEPAIQRPLVAAPSVGGASCPAGLTFASVRALMLAVYADGSPDENSARGKFDNIEHHFKIGNFATAKDKAWNLAEFTIDNRDAGKLVGSQAAINEFLNGLFCLVGLGPYFTGNSFFIYPSDNSQILKTTDGLTGVNVPANNVTEPTLLTIIPLTTPPVFDTKLDVWPLFYEFSITNAGGTGWVNPVIVGVCPGGNVPADVKANLLLGHQDGTTFELLPEADASFLDCSAVGGGSGNLVVNGDSTLVSAAVIGSSGVGGSTDDFSPIAPVDGRVVGSAGAGGGADDFRPRRGMTPSMNLVSLPSVSCSPITAVIGAEVDPACRPTITFATPTQHTPIQGVNVAWLVESGAGSIATPAGCSPFSSSFTQATDANGVTTVCWKLGNTPGTNTVTAIASPGGEAPDGVTFVYSEGGTLDTAAIKIRFTATGIRLDPAVTATGASGDYTGSAFTGSGTCTPNSLTPVLTYDTGDGQAPVNAGTYTLTVTCGVVGDDADIYSTQTATATITINQITTTTTVTCPASVNYNGSAQTPCSASATGSDGLNESLTVTYTNNTNAGVNTAGASASYAGDANHTSSNDSETFTINQATTTTTVTCPASVPYNGSAQTPCSATVIGSDGLNASVAVMHTNNTNAGTANASASYAGDGNHVASGDAKTFLINKLTATATAGSATIQFGAAVPSMPCNVAGLLAGDAGAVTCTTQTTTTTAGINPTTPLVSPATPTNYNVTLQNGTLTVIGYVQVGCFASPIYSSMPTTKSAQNKGSNLPVKCTLKWPNGTSVTNATGRLELWNLGTNPVGTNPPQPPGTAGLTILSAFGPTSNGNYSHALNTGVSFFVSGNAYYIKAVWSDGSVTTGYFRIK